MSFHITKIVRSLFDRLGYEIHKKSLNYVRNKEDILQVTLEAVLAYHLLGKEDFFFI